MMVRELSTTVALQLPPLLLIRGLIFLLALRDYSSEKAGGRRNYGQNSEQGQIIEIRGDVPAAETSLGGSTICAGAACGFSDAQTISKDAKERSASMRKLLTAVVLCVVFMSVEVAGGIKANSLAILTDAAHLLSDVAAFAISLFSLWASGWEATPRQTYGFFRIEILGALVSIQMIWLLAGILVYEAIARLIHDTGEVQGFLMSLFLHLVLWLISLWLSYWVMITGITMVMTIIMAMIHDKHHHTHEAEADHQVPLLKTYSDCEKQPEKKARNINIQGLLHVLGDSIQSIGVMIGGAIIWMLKHLGSFMGARPRNRCHEAGEGFMRDGRVVAIHELHIWAITVGKVLLACHVLIKREANADLVLKRL
ncbi:Metal tolerance protein A2 [Hibiscus syriacus]|uniref:Metal tolerance protein A2 n=1 Tax=Hibiscus syriacus TaxID=106335 RepID=A0A6A2ZRK2_HIBSY|nr:Metal tolerance protein A2 [Hibiscus syriacus]